MMKLGWGCRIMLVVLLVAVAAPVDAKVTRLEITSKQSCGTFRNGDYVI